MIYDGDKYIGAGALVDNNVVVTAAHKVRDYTRQGYLDRISELFPDKELVCINGSWFVQPAKTTRQL